MVVFEALNALFGDCLLLRYPDKQGQEKVWIIDGGPKNPDPVIWRDVLLPRMAELYGGPKIPVSLGMVSHIDDDHINGLLKITNELTQATSQEPAALEFKRFWFNSFEEILGGVPAAVGPAASAVAIQSLATDFLAGIDPHQDAAEVQSIGQGRNLAVDLRTLMLEGNLPVDGLVVARPGQPPFDIDGAKVTVLGPMADRLEKLRKKWQKALKKTGPARQAALAELFLPDSKLDSSVPNLSSIVVLVEVGGRRLILSGDARGDDIVRAWTLLNLGPAPATVDLVKMPHHGSIRNTSESFVKHFTADHYVFSANGKDDNPDPPVVEAMVKLHGQRAMTLHFTNADVQWSGPYRLEKDNTEVRTLQELIAALHQAYGGPWQANFRRPDQFGVAITFQ